MRQFEDTDKRRWSLSVNVAAVKRVRDLLDVDLLGMMDGSLIERLTTDPVLLCDVIYALCKPQADTEGISDEQFGAAMAGDAIDGATTAFLEELVDFFPSRRGDLLRQALATVMELEGMALTAATKTLASPELRTRMADELTKEMDAATSP